MKNNISEVSIIIPTKNSATTVLKCLESVAKQNYPIKEIIVVDNHSSDNSLQVVRKFRKTSQIPVSIIINRSNKGVGYSYNVGVKMAKSEYILFLHSDSCPASRFELSKLIKPLLSFHNVVASYPTAVVPRAVWDTYNFWQKYRFSRLLGEEIGFNAKFDCIKKSIFKKLGGFDEKRFARDESIGGEDADLYLRLKKIGRIVHTKAKVIHYHYLGSDYSLSDHFKTRKMLARTYGRLLRVRWRSLPLSSKGKGLQIPLGALLFLVKPTLAILPFIPFLTPISIVLFIIYSFLNSKTLYTTKSTLSDPKVIFLPFIDIFLVYYESFWTIQAFIFTKKYV